MEARRAIREGPGVYEVLFGVNTTHSCFNITAIDDSIEEDRMEPVEVRIGLTRVDQFLIQISPSAQTARVGILDNDCELYSYLHIIINAPSVYLSLIPRLPGPILSTKP